MEKKRICVLGAGSSIGHSRGRFPSISGFFARAKELGLNDQLDRRPLTDYAKNSFGWDLWRRKETDIEEFFAHIEIDLERMRSAALLEVRQQLLRLIQEVLLGLEREVQQLPSGGMEYVKFVGQLQKSDKLETWSLEPETAFWR